MTQPSTPSFLSIPFSEEAEQALIGAVLINPATFSAIASFLHADDFYLLRHQLIWMALLNLNERGQSFDSVILLTELDAMHKLEEVGGLPYLIQLINSTPSSVHAELYGRMVEQAAIRRRLMQAGDKIKAIAADETVNLAQVLGDAEAQIFAVSDSQIRRQFVPIYDALQEYYARIEQMMRMEGNAYSVPTGYRDLDTLLGGFQRSDLLIVAGRPGMGKTSFLLSLALNAARIGKRIAIFTMEMGVDQIVQRIISMETGINVQRLRLAQMDEQERARFTEAVGRLGNLSIFIDDTPALNPMELRTKCRRLYHEFGLDLVIVDYMQLMNAGKSYENNRVQEISYISRALKELARELNIPLISAAQLSRAVEQRQDKRPQLSDLRESGSIEQDADVVMFLYRDEVYNEATEYPNQADVIVAKHRNGPTGIVSLYFEKSLTRFMDAATRHIDLSDLG